MNKELYFLRSSEQKIVNDMFFYTNKEKNDEFLKYTQDFGLSRNDVGIYTLVGGEIAGAIWSRKFDLDTEATVTLVILEKFLEQGIESFMMEQFLQEAAVVYDALKVDITPKPELVDFYKSFGFEALEKNILRKQLERKEIVRPNDGYDPRKWMD